MTNGRSNRVKTERPAAGNVKRGRIVSIRVIMAGVLATMVLLSLVGVTLMAERATQRMLSGEVETRLKLQARNLAFLSSGALLSDYPELTLVPLIKEMEERLSDQAFAIVLDHENRIQGHPDARSIGEVYEINPGLDLLETAGAILPGERMLGDDEMIVALTPVLHPNGKKIGTALVGLNRSYLEGMVWGMRKSQLPLISIILVAGLITALIVTSKLLRPIGILREGLERIGRGDLETPVLLRDRTELGMLAETVNDMATQLLSAQADLVEKERLAHELDLANDIQRQLFPAEDLAVGEFRITGAHRPAAEVGGDYYDFFTLPDGRTGIAIADVSGKGLAGCLIMSMLSVLLRSLGPDFTSPSRLLVMLEERMGSSLKSGQFITMFYGILDPETGEIIYASAAHSPVLIHRTSGAMEWEQSTGIPLGAVPGGALATTLEDKTLTLEPGDLLVQYTDGVNEAFNAADEQFDFSGIEGAVGGSAAAGPHAVLQALRDAVKAWIGSDAEPFDDETLLVIGRQGAGASADTGQVISGCVSPAALAEADGLLTAARREGYHLRLPAATDVLANLNGWLAECPQLTGVAPDIVHLLECALYEACANIMEHGYDLDSVRNLDLWCLPLQAATAQDEDLPTIRFLLRDRGRGYRSEGAEEVDFEDAATRLKGRGLGREIIRKVMHRSSYFPGTAEGNLTLLEFESREHTQNKESLNV
ncbi:MAG: SpoIIE family protein phosphatase [bacterium]|nr:SpoIIE family protein phosphatase [bacterium]